MIKTVAELADHIVWLYAEIERLQNRLAALETDNNPPWRGEEQDWSAKG